VVYTIQQLKHGTGFDRDAKFLDQTDARELRAALGELIAIAQIYSDINVSERGQNAMAFARGALAKTEGI
jgi:hypothetical protein